MQHNIVQYTVKEGRAHENESLIKAVFAQLQELRPTGIRYTVFKKTENTFIHLIAFESEAANNAFTELPAFRAFQAGIKERVQEAPARSALSQIGDY
jgi:quinol monooxygenase YgiN